ncbi:MAG TPA: peptidoglycan DD-metalloendopeptidase family protein [Thermoanaerobaculia bacterium]|nr:peptidoglycan DD-metalloendopeptidase family protein [Thermoanaerobaculia bacterium]HUM28594.1 peptidoglycan DD-metalloendopeptidase family protein [Thermoanaerobaculia bacterium]HXK66798.1 peptidoglycan DD-metalloendopeptidase family protein [Thermoanaerobaculia bacterium]
MHRAVLATFIFLVFSSFAGFHSRSTVIVPHLQKPDLMGEMEHLVETVRSGDVLGEMLSRHVPAEEVNEAVEELRGIFSPRSVHPGWVVTYLQNSHGFTGAIDISATDGWTVHLSRWHEPWTSWVTAGVSRFQPAYASGEINSSLLQAFEKEGLTVRLVVEFVSIFQWDVDFFRDIRNGDTFEVLYLKDDDGQPGTILFARLVNDGKIHAAVRYDGGYYDLNGSPMKKAFLKAPLDAARISSRFSSSRVHPVLKRRMPHYGVDYAAPVGTPVLATGSGKVVFRGYRKGWGNTVTLQHPNRIQTSYLHLHKFASGIHVGSRIEAGQTIGYVGSTGLATGPHVDYRITVNGTYVNPLAFQAPPLPPLPEERKKDFVLMAQRILHRWGI